ncbi:hypothetical protein L207DRAFT_545111 [Hyaloscypha variabilis F]|uniref:Phosphoribosylaminoimidazole-succinocarboxamide synthase n=1 Tax=Hyaloscypha variabilis (strain UAMH 11265 / GT02V1 / F) TaxID=1149755 RepID=A0A2J6RL68_HYAVF|nr:hypothetical protein L207DRAFT_545111 [Hyaloscypha variabilis F]
MNLGDLDVYSVQHKRPQIQRILTSERPITPLDVRLEADRSPSFTSTISDDPTVIRWQTPPSRTRSPEEHSSLETLRPREFEHLSASNEAAFPRGPLFVRFDEDQIRSDEAELSRKESRMYEVDQDSNSSPPTPTDDTPYIRFAIDQLTRDEDIRAIQRPSSHATSDSYPVERIIPDEGLGYYISPEREREALALARKHRSSPREGLFKFNPTRPLSPTSNPSEVDIPPRPYLHKNPSDSEIFIPVDPPVNTPRYPDLTFIPMILRPASMIALSCLCLLMIAALMFCAIYSTYHHGLMDWYGGIYGGRYFLFCFLPQILAACIFIYIQCVMSAMTRIMPFTLMAVDDVEKRNNALFMGIFPQTMLWPRWDGPMIINVVNFFFWLSVFTIPLQSCLFSVVQFDGVWRWTTVQGIVWTLVAVYILILVATVISMLFFFRRVTGLMWDPRSLADLITLLPRSNCLRDYPGTDIMRSKADIRQKLALRSDRLGYWRTPNRTQGIFYCVGEAGASTRQYTLEAGKLSEKKSGMDLNGDRTSDIEIAAELYNTNTRFRYIPWFLRDEFVVFWCVAGFILLLALFITSFLPRTAIRNGFPPLVPVVATTSGWSPANFLYSFVPSFLGMLLYLFFQPLDIAIRKLAPWAALTATSGVTAESSLLLDYPAALPISSTLTALSSRHYRIALLSLLSLIFITIPILAGGLFFPLTTPSLEIRMIPNLSAYYLLLTLLTLYLLALLSLLPHRHQLHLPHDVSCLAEIFSFVYNSGILDDASFAAPKSRADLATRLMAVKARGERNRYAFGVFRGRDGKECMGVERLGRRGGEEVLVLVGSGRGRGRVGFL